jgi:hypothetical protein
MDSTEVSMEVALILRRVAKWCDYFTPGTFVSDEERDMYRMHVEDSFLNERQPLWPLDWRHVHGTDKRRGRHVAGN